MVTVPPITWFGDVGLRLFALALALAPKLAVAAIGYAYVFRRERQGDRMAAVNLVVGALIVDCALYASYGTTTGFLRPVLPFGAIELATLLVLVGLAARAHAGYVHGARLRDSWIPRSALVWLFFLAWLAVSAVRGLLNGNSHTLVIFEAQALVNIGGGALLVAGVPTEQLTAPRGLRRLALLSAPLAVLLMVTSVLHVRKSANLPLLPLYTAGSMGADAATVFATLGVFSVVLTLAAPRGRRNGFLAGIALVAAPLAAEQRAALLGAAVSVVLLVVALVARRGDGLRLTRDEAVAGAYVLVTILAFALYAGVAFGGDQKVSAEIDKTFNRTAKQQSAQSRENQWVKAERVIGEEPVFGHGLGVEFDHFEVGPNRIWRQDISHNIVLDTGMRMGGIGIGALVLALVLTTWVGLRISIRGSPMVAALALAATASFVGLVTKGMVESIFEKHRLALLLGLLVGAVWRAEVTDHRRRQRPGTVGAPRAGSQAGAVTSRS